MCTNPNSNEAYIKFIKKGYNADRYKLENILEGISESLEDNNENFYQPLAIQLMNSRRELTYRKVPSNDSLIWSYALGLNLVYLDYVQGLQGAYSQINIQLLKNRENYFLYKLQEILPSKKSRFGKTTFHSIINQH